MGSLQDALLKAGLADEAQLKSAKRDKPQPRAKEAKAPRRGGKPETPRGSKKPRRAPNTAGAAEASDLARAYKARERAEAQAKEAEKQRKLAIQEARRQRNLKLDALIQGNTLNRKDAELPRYFEHLGRIRRVLCTAEQREQLNQGQIGVVNLRGSYLLVSLDSLAQYRDIAPDLVPDLSPREPDDDGSHYPPVPDDLIW